MCECIGVVHWQLKGTKHVPTVLVTGASGYIATHIVQQLQQTGQYEVKIICTVDTVISN